MSKIPPVHEKKNESDLFFMPIPAQCNSQRWPLEAAVGPLKYTGAQSAVLIYGFDIGDNNTGIKL